MSKLREKFGVPPFSVLDTRQKYWQDGKDCYQELKALSGRDETLVYAKSAQGTSIYALRNRMREENGKDPSWEEIISEAKKRGYSLLSGTSIFDPFLCEILYRWFCPKNGAILDPFTGGASRGAVACHLDYKYEGFDVRWEQIKSNLELCERYLNGKRKPIYHYSSSENMSKLLSGRAFDMVFSCPPYFDLERYSKQENDLSNMDFDGFKASYKSIIQQSVSLLKDNRFAVFVIS
ncbi:MAG: SAM-dependent methyltransferase, partial [Bacteroidota bacterium]